MSLFRRFFCYFCGKDVTGPGEAVGGCGTPRECVSCMRKRWTEEDATKGVS